MGVGSTALLIATMATAAGDLEDGITLYQNKDYRGALAAFGRAGAQNQSPRRRALIHAYIGILQYRFGLTDDAKSSFEESLSHASIAFPDPSQGGAKRLYESLLPDPEPASEPKVKKKRRKRRRRKRRPRDPGEGPFPEEPDDEDEDEASGAIGPVATIAPPPPPIDTRLTSPPTVETTPDPDDTSVLPWVVAGGAGVAAVFGTVMIAVGRSNGSAAQDPMTDALEAERLYGTHRTQVGAGIAGLVVAGVAGTVAAVLFATE